ncbi:hypothetical protein [Streptomyces specialis]|uniref:hypothetical protein n=1 Tax=Streptomyces specialis TaxID=498367 RepID=UPI00073EF255|nr:hypothetical protein [Streptomyces specialis]
MSSSLRRGPAAAFFAFSIAALTACGAGNGAETGNIRPDNAAAQVDEIKVQNVNVVLPESGDGPGAISARLFNEGTEDQTLESVTLPDSGGRVELVPADGEDAVVGPAGGSVALGSGDGHAAAYIEDPAATDVALGNAQHVVFTLSETGEIGLFARVVPDTGVYEGEWGPSPAATPDPTASADVEDTPDPDVTDEADNEAAGDEATDGAADEATDEATGEDADDAGEGVTDEDTEGLDAGH